MKKLTNKQYREYDNFSRYSPFPIYYNTEDDKYVYGTVSHLKSDTPHLMHTVGVGDTLDSLALQYYNNPTYYWVIADYNRIIDPFAELTVGQKIKIPSFSGIEFED